MDDKLLNITMPTYNRPDLTRVSLCSLKENAGAWPYLVTVVDNGSNPEMVQELTRLKEDGFIDKLFLLDSNMGIACACNIGWQMTEAPFYMKLDNDMRILSPGWLDQIFALRAPLDPLSNFGPDINLWHSQGLVQTAPESPDPRVSLLPNGNIPGCALLIPAPVSNLLGRWNEDYGVYGAEDGDYGLRMHFAGLRQYLYDPDGLLEHLGTAPAAYAFDKEEAIKALHGLQDGKFGLFTFNSYLMGMGLRDLRPVPRYAVEDLDGCKVRLSIRKEYKLFRKGLNECMKLVTDALKAGGGLVIDPALTERIRGIMTDCGARRPGAPLARLNA